MTSVIPADVGLLAINIIPDQTSYELWRVSFLNAHCIASESTQHSETYAETPPSTPAIVGVAAHFRKVWSPAPLSYGKHRKELLMVRLAWLICTL
jgi:hypothetical protein